MLKNLIFLNYASSLLQAEAYIKNIEGSADRATMRKYLKSQSLYKGNWLISIINE